MTDAPQHDIDSEPTPSASAIWGGRFAAGPSAIMEAINASIDFDKRLYAHDIAGSKAHAAMLVRQGILSPADGAAIADGLDRVLGEMASGKFAFKASLEDIHMNVESRLTELVGEAAGRLHTARSRNDQVATDLRLWVRESLDVLGQSLQDLQAALIDRAEEHAAAIMPGFTHLQVAQPVTLGHHLLAYVEMFGRDRGRARDCRARLNECPLGAAALAGTAFPIDRVDTAATLGFDRPAANSIDAVSDRDFAVEYLAVLCLVVAHVSRLAEEIVLWCSDGFGFARLSDSFSTGSSIMPQKRNPDAAELARAKAGRVFGALQGLLVVLKGLPLAYGKDLQEDKEPVFDATDTVALCLAATTGMVRDMRFDTARMAAMAARGHPTATDLADWLVRRLGLPFRRAHHVTGAIVRIAEDRGCDLAELDLMALRGVEPAITEEVYSVLGVDASVNSRISFGGTAPDRVRAAVAEARQRFLERAP